MPLTPEQALEALKYVGVDPEATENIDAFKATFDKSWAKAEDLSSQAGRINGAFRTSIGRVAKELGIEYDRKAIEEAEKPTEVLEAIAAKVKETYASKMASLEEAAKGKGSEKVKEEYEAKLAQIAKDAEIFKADAQKWQGEYTNLNSTIAKQKEEAEVNAMYNKALEGVKFKPDMSPMERQGFEVYVKSNYKPMKEGEAFVWVDASGNKIKDNSKAASFKGIEQLVQEAAEANKLIASNPHAGKPVAKPETKVETPPVMGARKRIINPLAQ